MINTFSQTSFHRRKKIEIFNVTKTCLRGPAVVNISHSHFLLCFREQNANRYLISGGGGGKSSVSA